MDINSPRPNSGLNDGFKFMNEEENPTKYKINGCLDGDDGDHEILADTSSSPGKKKAPDCMKNLENARNGW